MKRIYNKFSRYSLEDCDCRYCLYFKGHGKGCTLRKCACAEEKAQAFYYALNQLKEERNGNKNQ